MSTKKVAILAVGTGGHIFPALAVAKELQKNGVDILWIGTKSGMENKIVPEHNIEINQIDAIGVRGKNPIKVFLSIFKLFQAFLKSYQILKNNKPDAVLGMGGYVSGIAGLAAFLRGIPIIIQEQNAVPGTANKLISKVCNKVFQAFHGTFPIKLKPITSGNPVFVKTLKKAKNNPDFNLLILGGSLGAKPINDVVIHLDNNINILHQTGDMHINSVKKSHLNKSAKVVGFIDDMSKAYQWADIVISRAGAMTVSELMLTGTPAILIPLPHAIDNHQFYNAKILSDKGAAILIEQKDLSAKKLNDLISNLTQEKLDSMSQDAKKLASPNASIIISESLLELINS